MKRRSTFYSPFVFLTLGIFLAFSACRAPVSPSPPPPTPSPSPSSVATPTPSPTVQPPFLRGETAYRYLRHLAVVLGPRDLFSGGEAEAARFLAAEFGSLGYQVELQPFDVKLFSRDVPRLSILAPEEGGIEANPLRFSATGEVTGPLVQANLGLERDFPEAGIGGKVALIRRGQVTFQQKVSNAVKAGAVAVIIYNNRPGNFSGTLMEPSSIPVVSIAQEDGEKLKGLLERGEVEVRVVVREKTFSSQNVVATKEGEGQGVVLLGAHYDSVPNTPGANDNASGTSVLLTIAQELAHHSLPFTLRFVAFGAEEVGLVGSRHYVRALSQEERRRIIAMLNFDALGTAAPLTVSGEGGLVARALDLAREQGIELRKGRLQGGASDDLSFATAGVPTISFFTPDFSRIHTPEDRIEFVAQERLQEAVTLAVRLIEALAQEWE